MRKKLLKIFIILGAIILLYIICPKETFAASAILNNLEFNAKLTEHGDMTVVEDWDITLDDASNIYKSFKKDMSKYFGVGGLQVYEIIDGAQVPLKVGNEFQSGCYKVTEDSTKTVVSWGTGTAGKKVRKKYRLAYNVKNIITKYNDCSELYWQFLGEDFSIPAKKITGTISIQGNIDHKSQIKAWGHINSMTGSIRIKDKNTVTFNISRYSANQFLEVRLLLPPNIVQNENRYQNVAMKDTIINEEKSLANDSNKYRILNTILLIGILALYIYIIIYEVKKIKKLTQKLKQIKLYNTRYEYFREIPNENSSPGRAAFLLNSSFQVEHGDFNKIFAATILDLKYKGYIDIKEKLVKDKMISYIELSDNTQKYKGKQKYVQTEIKELSKDENMILDYIISLTNDDGILPIQDINGHINYNEANKSEFVELASNVYSKIEVIETLNGNVRKVNSEKRKRIHGEYSWDISVNLGIIILVIGLTWFFLNLLFMIIAILPVISLVLLFRIRRVTYYLSEKGLEESQKWQGLKKYLEDYSLLNEKRTRDLGLWEQFLVYATAFGISDKVIEEIKTEIKPNEDDNENDDSVSIYEIRQDLKIVENLVLNINIDFSQLLSELYLNSSIDLAAASSFNLVSGLGLGGGFSKGGGKGAGGGAGGVR